MTAFSSLKIVGGLLPADLLGRVFAGDPQVPGTGPQTYGLERGESVRRQASRSWLYLLEVWQDFKRRVEGPGAAEAVSARVTRERWLRILLRELGFHEMAGGGFELEGKSFPVSHRSGHVPVHLLGWATDLDHKTPHVAARAPQSMLQELLNRDDAYLWAILSNGATLRLLRDSTALVGSSYVEFDLEAIFDGELFSDFVLLYLTCHESRFAIQDDGGPASCYLEQWRGFAAQQGERALDQLRNGVQQAISILGTGFLSHPANPHLRGRLDPRNADLKLDDFNRALLRLVYRMLFWFVAEDRGALLQPDPDDADTATRASLREARDRYAAYFSSARLRQLARRHRGGRHGDLFDAAQLVFDALGTEGGVPELALPGIGGIFESQRDDGTPLPLDEPLAGARLSNEALLGAVRALSLVKPRDGGAWRRVDFGNLGAEELGSVYESLLELIPRYDAEQLAYTLETLAGNERKESGSYYTPTSLVECLLDSALDPLLDEACAHGTPEERVSALLDITVCDPACGSGHFLVAAARRIAKRIAAEETGESEPPDASRPGSPAPGHRPLHLRRRHQPHGRRASQGLPMDRSAGPRQAAVLPRPEHPRRQLPARRHPRAPSRRPPGRGLHPDRRRRPQGSRSPQKAERRRTRSRPVRPVQPVRHPRHQRRPGQTSRRDRPRAPRQPGRPAHPPAAPGPGTRRITRTPHPETPSRRLVRRVRAAQDRRHPRHRDHPGGPGTIRRGRRHARTSRSRGPGHQPHPPVPLLPLARRVPPHLPRRQRRHATSTQPPAGQAASPASSATRPGSESSSRNRSSSPLASPEIANAANAAARKKMIAALVDSDSPADRTLSDEFEAELRKAAGWSHLLRESGRYPLTGQGDINTYAVFTETAHAIIKATGRLGIIVPTGIATDQTTSPFFREIIKNHQLDSLLDFVTNPRLWTEVGHRRYRFSILVVTGSQVRAEHAEFSTLIKHPDDLPPRGRRIRVPASDLLLVNPNTGTCPMFQTQRDADITIGIYKRVPVLWRDEPEENPWGISFMRMLDMANDSGLFRTSDQLERDGWTLAGNVFVRGGKRMLPLYEAKLIHHFDHRLACYSKRPLGSQDTELPRLDLGEKNDPARSVLPRYWVQDFDTLNEQKSKPGKPVYDHGVTSRLEARHWEQGLAAGLARHHQRDERADDDLRRPSTGRGRTQIPALLPRYRSRVSPSYLVELHSRLCGQTEDRWYIDDVFCSQTAPCAFA